MARGRKGGAEERAALLREALVRLVDGDAEAAESALGALVKSDTTDVAAYRALAHLFRERGEVGRAIHIHQNLLLMKTLSKAERGEVTRALGDDFAAGGFEDRARDAYEQALSFDRHDEAALDGLVELALGAGDAGAVRRWMKRLARARSEAAPKLDAGRWLRLAHAELEGGNEGAARKFAGWAVSADPSNVEAHAFQAELELGRGRPKAAIKALEAALEVESAPERRRDFFAQLRAAREATKGAERFRKQLAARLEAHPDDVAAREALGLALLADGQRDEGLAALREAVEQRPDDPETHAALGRALLAEGDGAASPADAAPEGEGSAAEGSAAEGSEAAGAGDAARGASNAELRAAYGRLVELLSPAPPEADS